MSLTQRHKSAINVALETKFHFKYSQYSNFYQNQAQSPICLTSFLLLAFSLFIFSCYFESSGHLWGRTRPLGEARCVLDCVCVCLWERVSLAEVSSPETAEQKGLWLTGLTFPFVLFFLFLSYQLPPPSCPFLNPWGWVCADLQPDSGEKKKTYPKNIVWAGKNKHLNSPLVPVDKWIRAREREIPETV